MNPPKDPLLSLIQRVHLRKREKNEKSQCLKNFIFLNASIDKMVPKGSSNEKNIQSMLAGL